VLPPLAIATSLILVSAPAASATPPAALDAPTAEVWNNRSDRVMVYAEVGDQELRLGSVDRLGVKAFRLPVWVAYERQPVAICVHPEDEGFDQESGWLQLAPRAHLEVDVPAK